MSFRPKRTLKEAIDLRDLSRISADDLLTGGLEYCQQVRRHATIARNSPQPLVCAKCGWAVYLTKNGLTKEYLWAHFSGASTDCEWFTGKCLTPDQVGARQFAGAQESPLHKRLKFLIAELLSDDPNAQNDVEIDTRLDGKIGYRKPDVRVTYADRPMAFEIQLSSTQLPTIIARENFYTSEGRSLIWIAWNPDLGIKSDTPQAFLDILTAHNDNLFSIDEETTRISRQNRELTLRVHWWGEGRIHNKLVTLKALTYPSEGLPYAVEKPAPWHQGFKDRWIRIAAPDGSSWRDKKYLYQDIIAQLNLNVTDTELEIDYQIDALLCLLLSLENDKIIGSRQKNLTEMLHTFLTTPSRQPLARIVEHAVKASGQTILLSRPKTQQILKHATAAPQVGKSSIEAQIVRALFPAWAKPLSSP